MTILDAIRQVIDKEIMWCEEHPDKVFSAEYRKGFVNGLIQAKTLLQEVKEVLDREAGKAEKG